MAPDTPRKPGIVRFGHHWRLAQETRTLTMLILGHVIVFLLSIGHDEIVAEMVADGWIFARFAEQFELLFGLVLFVCWGALTVRLMTILQRARAGDCICPRCNQQCGDAE
ncbi:hypothetical protein [Tateyamaria omphalii]|uniref:Uncharacterized protein n=1 Tax=Tateyamaria omphalii TaxID=299262 RepID=A0A1P8MUB5_9RHOB|nr:hypothetical protein [Tateyamaria omphalii]APX11529.1 hypothetical protein BWR18_07420 [Tateyamaria omphalii]